MWMIARSTGITGVGIGMATAGRWCGGGHSIHVGMIRADRRFGVVTDVHIGVVRHNGLRGLFQIIIAVRIIANTVVSVVTIVICVGFFFVVVAMAFDWEIADDRCHDIGGTWWVASIGL